MASSSQYTPKSYALIKIPLFDENNFSMWKLKAMVSLEAMDYDVIDIIERGPYLKEKLKERQETQNS